MRRDVYQRVVWLQVGAVGPERRTRAAWSLFTSLLEKPLSCFPHQPFPFTFPLPSG